MSIGLNLVAVSSFCMALVTSVVAAVQISISFCLRSPSVMMPRRNCFSTLSASTSCRSRISYLSAGVDTSSMEIVSPERIAQLKQSSLIASSELAATALGNSTARWSTSSVISRLRTGTLT